jgi:acyl transferase domain-containing protein
MVNKDVISNSLGIPPIPSPPNPVFLPSKEKNDYEYARQNMYDIIEKGQSALEDIVDIARQSESPRAYEVVTNLIKTLAETNKDLMELAKKNKEINKADSSNEGNKTVNNNLFVGSSSELLKMIRSDYNE